MGVPMREAIERFSIWFIILMFLVTALDFAYEEFLPTMTGWAAPVVSKISIMFKKKSFVINFIISFHYSLRLL